MRSAEHWPRALPEDDGSGSGSSPAASANVSLKSSPILRSSAPISFPSKQRISEETKTASPHICSRSLAAASSRSLGSNLLADSLGMLEKTDKLPEETFEKTSVTSSVSPSLLPLGSMPTGGSRSRSAVCMARALQEARDLTYKHSHYKSSPRFDLGPGPSWTVGTNVATVPATHIPSNINSFGRNPGLNAPLNAPIAHNGSISGQSMASQQSNVTPLVTTGEEVDLDDIFELAEHDGDRRSVSGFAIRSLKALPPEIDLDGIFRLETPDSILANNLKAVDAKLNQFKTLFNECKALVDSYAKDSSRSQAEIDAQVQKLQQVQRELPIESIELRVEQAKIKVQDYKERLAAVQQRIQLQENDNKKRHLRIIYVKRIILLVSLLVALIAVIWCRRFNAIKPTDVTLLSPDPLSDTIQILEHFHSEDIISVAPARGAVSPSGT